MRLLPTDTLRGEGQGYHEINELSVMHNNSTSLFALFREPHGRTTYNTTQQYTCTPVRISHVRENVEVQPSSEFIPGGLS